MSSDPSRSPNNVLPLKLRERTAAQLRATKAAGQVRHHLSLLQGYADLMEGLSPEQHLQVLRVMAGKIHELTQTLRPFVAPDLEEAPAIEDYRRVRSRNRELMADYRQLLTRLRQNISEAHAVLPPAALK
jgi:hypothetical protein